MSPTLTEKIDKSEWGDGLWQHEPDRLEFEHAGLPCLMRRNQFGVWCGYAAVPPGHPWHGFDAFKEPACNLDAHGGLTFSGACSGDICHVPKPGEPDNVWWFGFDCNHSNDYAPGLEAKMRGLGVDDPFLSSWLFGAHNYKHLAYVQDEVKALAEQLAKVSSQNSL